MPVTSTASSAASQTVATAKPRKGLILKNTDANACHVMLDSQAATTTLHSFTLDLDEDAFIADYHGEVRAIWAVDGTGALLVTEW